MIVQLIEPDGTPGLEVTQQHAIEYCASHPGWTWRFLDPDSAASETVEIAEPKPDLDFDEDDDFPRLRKELGFVPGKGWQWAYADGGDPNEVARLLLQRDALLEQFTGAAARLADLQAQVESYFAAYENTRDPNSGMKIANARTDLRTALAQSRDEGDGIRIPDAIHELLTDPDWDANVFVDDDCIFCAGTLHTGHEAGCAWQKARDAAAGTQPAVPAEQHQKA